MIFLKKLKLILFLLFATYESLFSSIDSLNVSFCIDTSLLPIKISDFIESRSDIISLDYDDWGIKSANLYFNIPDFTFIDVRDDFIEKDPLFNDIPNLWRKSIFYANSIKVNSLSANSIGYLTKPISGFGYVKGDYSFLNVDGFVSGRYYEKGIWGFEFSNMAYDGRYNLYGSKYGNSIGESLNQNYRLNTEFYIGKKILKTSLFYNKYMPGVSQYNMSTAYYDFVGSDKNYRIGGYIILENPDTSKGCKIGFLTTANIYRRVLNNIKMNGESSQYQAFFKRNVRIFKQNLKIAINAMNYNFFSKNEYGKYELRANIETFKKAKSVEFFIKGGFVNTNTIFNTYVSLNFLKDFYTKLYLTKNFYFYPLAYEVMSDSTSVYNLDEGFPVQDNGLELYFKNKYFIIGVDLKYILANYYLPFKNKPELGYLKFNKISIEDLFVRVRFDFKFKDYIRFSNKIIIPTKSREEGSLSLYVNNSLKGYFYLFNKNLKLYFSGSIWFLKGYDKVAWFEETNSIGLINFDVFNNDKFYISGEIGAKVRSFYLYYATYNFNGRLFSAMPLMPYRNRLYMYGVKWWFIE